ncbi:MAG TPA: hypothetical protein VK928_01605, partial [Longimicrobiales bacterium]|nr:hypothetical protein [Longimicrobiales bacterium]
YTLLANNVAHNGKVYAPAPSSQQVTVTSGQTTNVAIAYAETQGGFNLDIAGMYVTQATQTMTGAVPLIAGRSGLLRVFVRGSLANTSIPDVRVRFYRNGQLVETRVINAPSSSTPTLVDEGVLAASWNYLMPASLIQPGLAIVAEVDVANGVEETNENDNVFPSNGTPLSLDVRTTVPFQTRLVPVLQPNGQTGDVTEANKNTYTDFANALYPLPSIDADVRAPYSFSAILPAAYDTVWSRLLNEIRLLRGADGSSRYYYGVFKPSYSSGGTGLGYIGLPAAIGVDWATGSSNSGGTSWRAMTAAHEWGHNFGRAHVGCGNPANPDVNYPYEGGRLGLHGWDMRTNEIRLLGSHFDLLSYCLPYWSSDYTYNAVMNFRGATGGITAAAPQPSLLVWGRTLPDGSVVLEPAFEVMATPSLPSKSGRFRLAALDDTGATLFDMSFDGDEVDHMEGVRHFNFVIPLSRLRGRDAAMLRVSGGREDAVQRRAPPAAVEAGALIDEVKVTRTSGNRVRLQWDVARTPMVLVRDPRTGAVLSFARGGDQLIAVPGTEVELNMSDGVKSTTRRVKVQQ